MDLPPYATLTASSTTTAPPSYSSADGNVIEVSTLSSCARLFEYARPLVSARPTTDGMVVVPPLSPPPPLSPSGPMSPSPMSPAPPELSFPSFEALSISSPSSGGTSSSVSSIVRVLPDNPFVLADSSSNGRDSLIQLLGEVRTMATLHQIPTQERLWQILNDLEHLKAIEHQRASQDLDHNLHLLYEVEEAVLPLISALEQASMTEVPVEQASYAELATFDKNFRLVMNTTLWSQLLQSSSKNQISNIVSFLGDTHVGKSTLLAHFLGGDQVFKPPVAAPQQTSPTTANVNIYNSAASVENLSRIRFLDMEGENGSKSPATLPQTMLREWLLIMNDIQYQEQRRAAVAEHLPRLAFVTSDIVVYISNESFANASYMERVRKLVFDSTESVDSAYSPSLILVYNKCSLDEEFDIDQCTANFFENEENEEIKQLYTEVKCLCIPHYDQMKKVRRPGQSNFLIDGDEIYRIQMEKFAQLLKEMMQRRMQMREDKGSLYSEHVWCILFKMVIERFDQKLRMADILTSIVKPRSPLASKAFNYFSEIYRYVGRYNKDEFLRCRKAAIVMVAFMFVEHMRMKQLEYDKYVISSLRNEAFRKEIRVTLEELSEHIDKLAPCDAVYPQSPADQLITCTQEKLCHGSNHRSSQKIFGPEPTEPQRFRVFQHMRAWLGIGYRPTWEGRHCFHYPTTLAEDIEQCARMIELASKMKPSSYYPTKMSVLHSVARSARNLATPNASDFCWLCLTGTPNRSLRPCQHVFCQNCLKVLSQVTSEQVPLELEEFEDLSSAPVSNHCCPLCRTTVVGVNPYAIPYRTLEEKYLNLFANTMLGSLSRARNTVQLFNAEATSTTAQ